MKKRYLWRRLLLVVGCVAGASAICVLLRIDPRETRLTVCWFHQLTGLYCPGCGATRALYLALHGQFAEAFRMNPLLPFLLGLLLYLFFSDGLPWFGFPRILPPFCAKNWQLWAGVAGILVFTVLRNLPGSWLMPV